MIIFIAEFIKSKYLKKVYKSMCSEENLNCTTGGDICNNNELLKYILKNNISSNKIFSKLEAKLKINNDNYVCID